MNKPLDVPEYMHLLGRSARAGARVIARTPTAMKNQALIEIADVIVKREALARVTLHSTTLRPV